MWCHRNLKIKHFSVELIDNPIYFFIRNYKLNVRLMCNGKINKSSKVSLSSKFCVEKQDLIFFYAHPENMLLCSLWGLLAHPKENRPSWSLFCMSLLSTCRCITWFSMWTSGLLLVGPTYKDTAPVWTHRQKGRKFEQKMLRLSIY